MRKDPISELPVRNGWDFPKPKALGPFGPWVYSSKDLFGSSARLHDFGDLPVPEVGELPNTQAGTGVAIPSPVKAWKLRHANAKIREDAKKYTFKSSQGNKGAVHAARLACNNPNEDDWAVGVGKGVGGENTVFAGIYDGHAGWPTSTVLRESLVPRVSQSLCRLGRDEAPESVDNAITKAFTGLDYDIMRTARDAIEGAEPGDPSTIAAIAPAVAGSCALLSMYDPEASLIRVACVGDSRAVLGELIDNAQGTYQAKPLSVDQNGHTNKDEVARVKAEHPGEDAIFSEDGRLNGIMVTRAFGDHRWKWDEDMVKKAHHNLQGPAPRPNTKTPPYLTAEPVITTTSVTTSDFVILASDGLWDHISSEHAVQCVAEWLQVKRGLEQPTPASTTMHHEPEFKDDYPTWFARPEHFVVEDLDHAAVHLLKNALGGKRRKLFTSIVSAYPPAARGIRDDITVQVMFFGGIERTE